MKNDAHDRAELIKELDELRGRVSTLEAALAEKAGIDFELAKKDALLDNISDLAYVCDDKGNIIYLNHVFEKLSGHAASEFIGRPFSNLFNEKDLKTANDAYLRTLKGESPVYEISFVRTGTLCEYRNHPFVGMDGDIIGVLGTARDITEKKKTFEELEKNDFFLREAQRVARIGSYVLEFETGLWTSSEVMDEIFGIDSDFRRDHDAWSRLLHPEHREEMLDYFRDHVIAGRNDFDREYRIVRLSDRAERWVSGLGKLVFNSDGKLVRMIGTIQDITEKKKTEEMLKSANQNLERLVLERTRHLSASEARYRSLVNTIQHGIEECDTSGVITFSNPSMARMYIYETAELVGSNIWDHHASAEEGEALKSFLKKIVVERPAPTPYFCKVRTKDNRVIDVKVDWNYKYDETGALTGFISVITDITKQKRVEEALKGSESRLNEAQHVAKMGSWACDFEKNINQPSAEFLRIFDISCQDFEKEPYSTILKVIHPEDRDMVERKRSETISGRKKHHVNEYRLLLRDGTVKSIHSEAEVTYDSEGNPVFMVGTVQDITDKKLAELEKERLQAQLLHSQKMEAIGTMAGGIAHDFNNIMTVVSSLTELMLHKTGPNDPFFKYLQPISESCRRAVNLVQQLLLFSSRKPKKMSAISLNEIASELKGFFEHLLSEDIIVDMDLKRGLWEVNADRVRIEQVLTNLVLNSSEAMADGGTVTVRTKNAVINEDQCAGVPGCSPGRYVCITVEDTGIGMDQEVQQHIFEPFFTTKKAKNSGMGLAVVYGVVKDHNGWVSVQSAPGAGAAFRVFLPAVESVEETCQKTTQMPLKAGGGKSILLVEDEKLVRKSAAMVLEENGYIVFEASNAESAIKLFNLEKGVFDLILSDVVMPGKSGLQMIAPLMDINPGVPVLLCSGYLDDKAQITEIIRRGFAFIQKPYDVGELLYAVEDTISQHKSRTDPIR
ncbi:MAG: PAS domain S-box protein [Deltaproteobacteria bacterium]|nr:PAS domain S-box protein [Deltaproteobacteria bacterium]